MIRFYCTECKKVKRVRRLPKTVEKLDDGTYSSGICRFHVDTGNRATLNSRTRVLAHLGSTSKMSATAAKSKSKKG